MVRAKVSAVEIKIEQYQEEWIAGYFWLENVTTMCVELKIF